MSTVTVAATTHDVCGDDHRPKYYTVTLKSRLRVTQGHWKWYHLKAWVKFPICLP